MAADHPEPADLEARKSALRKLVLRRRALAAADKGPAVATLAAERFIEAFQPQPGQVVAGYWAMGDELDDCILLAKLQRLGLTIALPAIGGDRQLILRQWDMSQEPPRAAKAGAKAIPAPGPECAELQPNLIVVPLVAYDREGWRLGQGGGYYDRLLRRLRADASITAIGIAFAVQQVPHVPHGRFDERLDWIVTERGVEKLS